MAKDVVVRAAWLSVLGAVLAAVIAGLFAMVQTRRDKVPVTTVQDKPSEKPPSPDGRLDPNTDYITILDSKFDTAKNGELYIGGHIRVGYFGKGPIQSNTVTSCLIYPNVPCADINFVRIGAGVHDYLFAIDDPTEPEKERDIVLCIGDQNRISNYLNTEPRDRPTLDEPACATATVKR